MPPDVELALSQIAREAVGNARRHSRGAQVEIVGRLTADLVELAVRDDGVGLSEDAAERGGHLGLPSMRQRTAAIWADISIDRRPEDGTPVVVRWRRG